MEDKTAVDVTTDFKSYQDRVTSALVEITRSAGKVAAQDVSFHRSGGTESAKSFDSCDIHLLKLTNRLLKAVTRDSSTKTPPNLRTHEHVEDNWRRIVDVVDDLLEKADASLDEFNGVIKRMSPQQPSTPEPTSSRNRNGAATSNANILKPQARFEHEVDNFDTSPWKPLPKTKPHAIIPLDQAIGPDENGYKQPYAFEIENAAYPDTLYKETVPIPFTWPDKSEPAWVDTEEGVQAMLKELKQAKEIAVDLEHNDKNSYIGMVCLMQISTRTKDWIVDTLKPWRENLQVLNEVFADPTVIKVFHGSTSDMIWLQRDLGLYVVGLIDTYHACAALGFPSRSLAYLLERYVNIEAQKQFQLADWRVRPLPKELLDYARTDTHYLLYIFDNLRNELVRHSTSDCNLTDWVIQGSKSEALQRYERTNYDAVDGLGHGGWLKMIISRSARPLDNEQFGVFRTLHQWRDTKARERDESEHSVMPTNWLWTCAQLMPVETKKLFDLTRMGRYPPSLLAHAQELVALIKQGQEAGRAGPSVQDVIERNKHRLPARFQHRQGPQHTPSTNASVAATLQRLAKSGEVGVDAKGTAVEGSTDAAIMRATRSTFWGNVPHVSIPPSRRTAATQIGLQSVMPLSSMEVSVTGPDSTSARRELETTPPEGLGDNRPPVGATSREAEIFTLNDRKKKRKAEDVLEDGEIDSNPDSILLDTLVSSRAAKKAAKKARKEAIKAEQAAAQADFRPFDYANAPSMMHAQSDMITNDAGTTTPKPMNPYAKALDTSTGARRNRMGKELAGRSQTFRS